MWFRDYIETIEIISKSNRSIPEKFGAIIGHRMSYNIALNFDHFSLRTTRKICCIKLTSICPKKDLSNKGYVPCRCSPRKLRTPKLFNVQITFKRVHLLSAFLADKDYRNTNIIFIYFNKNRHYQIA